MTSNNRTYRELRLIDLSVEDLKEERRLYFLQAAIIGIDKNDNKAERDRQMADVRTQCISVHNARIAIAVARQKVIREMADRRAYFKKISSIEEYQQEYQQVWTL